MHRDINVPKWHLLFDTKLFYKISQINVCLNSKIEIKYLFKMKSMSIINVMNFGGTDCWVCVNMAFSCVVLNRLCAEATWFLMHRHF